MLVAAYPVYYCMQRFVGHGATNTSAGVQGLLIVLLFCAMLALTIFTFKPAKHTQKEVDDAKEQGIELELDSPKACELKDLLANVFILVYPTLHYQNGGLDIDVNGMTTNVKNLFVAGEAVGGIHGKNRLMGNSLLDIIVFGRNAGQNAAKYAKETTVGKLTLDHIARFEKECADAGIVTNEVSPKLLPDYARK